MPVMGKEFWVDPKAVEERVKTGDYLRPLAPTEYYSGPLAIPTIDRATFLDLPPIP